MNLCSHNHEEICFEDRKCPYCADMMAKTRIIDERDGLISDLKEHIRELERRLEVEPVVRAIEAANQQ